MKTYRPGLTAMPPQIEALPVSRGFPVPWFVEWLPTKDGDEPTQGGPVGKTPEFRLMNGRKVMTAVNQRRCWVCGQKIMGETVSFVIGPMCGINRVSAEPPNHCECALWSTMNCPFLTKPQMVRRDNDLPVGVTTGAGEMIRHNPGAMLIWTTKSYSLKHDNGGVLFVIGDPVELTWMVEGKNANRSQVEQAVEKGLVKIRELCDRPSDFELVRIKHEWLKTQYPKD